MGLYTEGNLCYKIGLGLYLEGNLRRKSIGVAYSWKEIYVSSLQKGFTETRLEDVDPSKTQPCRNFV